MRRFLGDNALGLVFAGLFLLALTGQAIAGHAEYNEEQMADGLATISYGHYLTTSHFMVATLENWQSEFLQFFVYIWLTIWLVQKGSAESKDPGEEGTESDEQQLVGEHARRDSAALARSTGPLHSLFANSLFLVFGVLFLLSLSGQAVTGWVAYNEQQLRNLQPAETFAGYLAAPDFWSRTMQNWQSEFLAVGSMAVFSIWLRQRGSPESKRVGEPAGKTGSDV